MYYTKSRTGLVVDGSVRDEAGLRQIHRFQVMRGVGPSALKQCHADAYQRFIRFHSDWSGYRHAGRCAVRDPE